MSEGAGLIQNSIKAYKDARISIIEKLSNVASYSSELSFLDEGYITSKIDDLKVEYNSVDNELNLLSYDNKMDKYIKDKTSYLNNRKRSIYVEMSLLGSNNFKNLDQCVNLLEGIDSDLIECIQALKLYHLGSEGEAFKKFQNYFKRNRFLIEHFLINRVYGELLFKAGQYEVARVYFKKAVEKRPEDIDVHGFLKEIYSKLGDKNALLVEESIIDILSA
ncbi:tetratricopeptide repeat protein [Clostridium sp.]